MKKLILAIAAAVIAGTVGTSVHAEEVLVKKGDTLWGFSQAYGVSVDHLTEWNGLTSDIIHPDDKLVVNPIYKVVKGDNLWDISRQQHVTVEELQNWNKLTSDLILPGQVLAFKEAQAGMVKIDHSPTQMNEQPALNKESIPAPSENPPVPEKTEGVTEELTMEATAYTASCEGCSGITSTGINLLENPNQKVIAVDPSIIPLGTKVYVEGYGEAIAGDIGGAIKGHKVDIFIPTKEEAVKWGRKTVKVQILK